ncbi:hypothetical protein RA19_02895 [Leisingera sp. ANG-M1]|uniref:hypothetical protein n=1 Tax=Leisingera sp. ANG-M1 TaxID=1577895 RepID=UPI000580A365|nr:hypothetical protein [Leisingera sp. ANG-M1]KIC12211.1 hypothetical protein RA19_02895 [Leisingera sp. ANG-M1]
MLAAILIATAGVAIAAAVIDSDDEDQSAEPSEDGSTPPVEEDGLTVVTEDGEPEQIDPETLDELNGAKVFEGTSEDETVYIDTDTISEFRIWLGQGGADTVVTGLGQSIDTTDDDTGDAGETADTVRLIYTPGQPEEVFEHGTVRGSFKMDEEDELELEFPEGTGGTILPVYYVTSYYPADACCSGGEDHGLALIYVPEGVEYSEEDLVENYETRWEDRGMVPIAELNLGQNGWVDYTHDGGEAYEYDDVTNPPVLSSNLEFASQITINTT